MANFNPRSVQTIRWETMVDNLVKYGVGYSNNNRLTLTAAAIIGHDGHVWAQSSAFPRVTLEEIKAIMEDFDKPDNVAPKHLGGLKYIMIQGEKKGVLQGKRGYGGFVVKKTINALVFGVYEEPMTLEQCKLIIQIYGDYLNNTYSNSIYIPQHVPKPRLIRAAHPGFLYRRRHLPHV